MDSANVADEAPKADETASVMGNESSKLEITSDPLASSTQGQFHKVLVEPEYSILQPPGIRTLELPEVGINEKPVKESPVVLTEGDAPSQQEIPEEVKANGDIPVSHVYTEEEIIKTSRIIVERSIEEALKSLGGKDHPDSTVNREITDIDRPLSGELDNTDEKAKTETAIEKTEIVKGDLEIKALNINENGVDDGIENSDVNVDGASALTNTDIVVDKTNDQVDSKQAKREKKSKKNKAKEQYLREREIIDSVKEFIKDEEKKSKDKKESKKGLSFPSMFKFSKRKQKSPDTDSAVDNVTAHINEDSNATSSDTNHSDANDGNQTIGNKPEIVPDTNGVTGNQPGVRRLNSLDSGIVMDKYSDNVNGVEYAVVNKTKKTNPSPTENKSNRVDDLAEEVDAGSNKSSTEPVYINGDKTDEDFVYINERAVDVPKADKESEASKDTDKDNDTESVDVADAIPKIKKVDQIRKTEKNKIKKKSWSFQFPGHKKPEAEKDDGPVSMDPGVSHKEHTEPGPKKSKWRFGKFSFRKVDDMSASTPDLNKQAGVSRSKSSIDSEISESSEKSSDKKKGTKLKQIKAKKETKKKLKDAHALLDGDIAVRSSSLSDIHVGSNMPRSRRSIVEDDIDYLQTDAFEGVAVSDLSQDEDDTQVSMDPTGVKARKTSEGKRGIVKEIQQNQALSVDLGQAKVNVDGINLEQSIEPIQTVDKELKEEVVCEEPLKSVVKETHDEIKASVPLQNVSDQNEGVYVNIKKGTTGKLEGPSKTAPEVEADKLNVKLGNEDLQQIVEATTDKLETIPVTETVVETTEVLETESRPMVVEKLPSKYIYAGDDEYAQIIKSTKDFDVVGDGKDDEVNVQLGITDTSFSYSNTGPVDQEGISESLADVVAPVEETIINKTESIVECKAAPDCFGRMIEQENDKVMDSDDLKTDSNQEADALAYSNLIYSDESFVSALKHNEDLEKQDQADSESDAYVELEKLVKDFKDIPTKERPANLDIITTGKDSVTTEKDSVVESKAIGDSTVEKTTDPTTPISPTVVSRASIKLSVVPPKVIIMKEVGVQAPDIHMPLDRELDFGFVKDKPNVVSVGVQVADGTEGKINENGEASTATTPPVAYF